MLRRQERTPCAAVELLRRQVLCSDRFPYAVQLFKEFGVLFEAKDDSQISAIYYPQHDRTSTGVTFHRTDLNTASEVRQSLSLISKVRSLVMGLMF